MHGKIGMKLDEVKKSCLQWLKQLIHTGDWQNETDAKTSNFRICLLRFGMHYFIVWSVQDPIRAYNETDEWLANKAWEKMWGGEADGNNWFAF